MKWIPPKNTWNNNKISTETTVIKNKLWFYPSILDHIISVAVVDSVIFGGGAAAV